MKKFILTAFLLLFYTLGFCCTPSTTVDITGPDEFCSTGDEVSYTIVGNDTKRIVIDLTGGVFVPGSFDVTGTGSTFTIDIGTTSATFTATANTFDVTIEVDVEWTSSSGTIEAEVFRGLTTSRDTDEIDVDEAPPPTITGSTGVICESTTSLNYSASGVPAGSTITWTTTSSGAALSPSTATGFNVTFTGFTPGNFYSINASYTCSSGGSATNGITVVTGSSCLVDNSTSPAQSHKEEVMDFNGGNTSSSLPVLPTQQMPARNRLKQVKVFPNPVARGNNLEVQLPQAMMINVENHVFKLYNSLGVEMQNIVVGSDRKVVPTSEYPAGTYYLQCITCEENVLRKVLIQN